MKTNSSNKQPGKIINKYTTSPLNHQNDFQISIDEVRPRVQIKRDSTKRNSIAKPKTLPKPDENIRNNKYVRFATQLADYDVIDTSKTISSSLNTCSLVEESFDSAIIPNFNEVKKALSFNQGNNQGNNQGMNQGTNQGINQGNYRLKLLYRASENNFDIKKFHKMCKNITDTVTICKVLNGNIVIGYNPLDWNDEFKTERTYYKTDTTNSTFLVNFTLGEKYELVKTPNNKAIVGCEFLGPTFGGGYDFSIGNFANKKYTSVSDFPTSFYNPKQKRKIYPKKLTGINDEAFLIEEWEIFQIIFSTERVKDSITCKSRASKFEGSFTDDNEKQSNMTLMKKCKKFLNGILKMVADRQSSD